MDCREYLRSSHHKKLFPLPKAEAIHELPLPLAIAITFLESGTFLRRVFVVSGLA